MYHSETLVKGKIAISLKASETIAASDVQTCETLKETLKGH